ncbi:hypothetical protein H2200_010522 [Cladophialophora chaetospira]|uniref:NAD(P)-binding protein n=1 Tax=Cladophialophora chaetospira TaxID=386627 RepID=A0AA38X1S7_9EURO|nr:hypothetical protein H2200_010522 [Cladophialophora chaetospira]
MSPPILTPSMDETEQIPFHEALYPAIDPAQYPKDFFQGKVILITGSGRGTGRALGLAFCSLSASVVFTDLTQEDANSAAEEARSLYPQARVTSIAADVRDYNLLQKLHQHTLDTLGEVDVLINNAGWGDFLTFDISKSEDTTSSDGQTETGVIICTTTTGAVDNYPFCIPYMIAKTGQAKLMHCLQLEVENDTEIQCFHIHPGCPKTKMGDPDYAMRPYVGELRPNLKKWVYGYLPSLNEDMDLAVWSMVFLASGKAAPLKGRYLNANHDIGEVLKRAKLVKDNNLYILKADTFQVVKEKPQQADFYRTNKHL